MWSKRCGQCCRRRKILFWRILRPVSVGDTAAKRAATYALSEVRPLTEADCDAHCGASELAAAAAELLLLLLLEAGLDLLMSSTNTWLSTIPRTVDTIPAQHGRKNLSAGPIGQSRRCTMMRKRDERERERERETREKREKRE